MKDTEKQELFQLTNSKKFFYATIVVFISFVVTLLFFLPQIKTSRVFVTYTFASTPQLRPFWTDTPTMTFNDARDRVMTRVSNYTPTTTLITSTYTPKPYVLTDFDVNRDGKVTCEDFSTQGEALLAFRNGYKSLDSDGDGMPCENLPVGQIVYLTTSPQPTVTDTNTPTRTFTPTPTNTRRPTRTPSNTPTLIIITQFITVIVTPTYTPTPTPTETDTITPSPTDTSTPTDTETSTPTETPTPDISIFKIETDTSTPTP
jgi:hypothetical protein